MSPDRGFMDLSKLRKLSTTKEQTEQQQRDAEAIIPAPAPVTAPAPTSSAFCVQCGLPLRASARFCDSCGAPTARASAPSIGSGAEAWLSIAFGVILLLMNPTMLKFVSSKLFGTSFAPFVLNDGSEIPYPKVYPTFFNDLCITLFAAVLIVESIALVLVHRSWLLWSAFL